jgi:hypothetical protein
LGRLVEADRDLPPRDPHVFEEDPQEPRTLGETELVETGANPPGKALDAVPQAVLVGELSPLDLQCGLLMLKLEAAAGQGPVKVG